MSSKLLTELDPTHTLQDDMESLVYVVLYTALHHLPHNLNPDQLAQFIKDFFDASYQWGSQLLGGGAKQANIADRHMTKRVKFEDANFQRWLDTVLDMHMSMEEAVRDEEVTDMWTDTRHLDSFGGSSWRTSLWTPQTGSTTSFRSAAYRPKFRRLLPWFHDTLHPSVLQKSPLLLPIPEHSPSPVPSAVESSLWRP